MAQIKHGLRISLRIFNEGKMAAGVFLGALRIMGDAVGMFVPMILE